MSLSITNIKNMLGESSNSTKDLALSTKINMWSKVKPYNPNYTLGFSFSPYDNATNALDAAKTLANGGLAWTYQRPTSNYNFGSFNGYNHNAGVPLYYKPTSTTLYTGDSLSVGSENTLAGQLPEIFLSDIFSADYTVRVAYRRSGNSIASLADGLTVPATEFIGGYTYECCTVISNGTTLYLTPYPYFTVTRANGSPIMLVGCSLNTTRTSASNIIMRAIGQARTITDIQAVWRTSASRVWSTAGSGEADGTITISTQDILTTDTTLYNGTLPAILSVSTANINTSNGSLYLRFRYKGYLQQVLLSAGGAVPEDPK